MKKFTFKTNKSTGRFGSFFADFHYIKMNKVQVGQITDEVPHRIRLQVMKTDINEDGNKNCPWKWITLQAKFKTLNEAKEFLNKNVEQIMKKYSLKLQNI